jgi:hypothetical protein
VAPPPAGRASRFAVVLFFVGIVAIATGIGAFVAGNDAIAVAALLVAILTRVAVRALVFRRHLRP